MEIRKKIVIEEIIQDKSIQFIFDEDTNVGCLYKAADCFRAFVVSEINKIEERDREAVKENKKCQEKQENHQ